MVVLKILVFLSISIRRFKTHNICWPYLNSSQAFKYLQGNGHLLYPKHLFFRNTINDQILLIEKKLKLMKITLLRCRYIFFLALIRSANNFSHSLVQKNLWKAKICRQLNFRDFFGTPSLSIQPFRLNFIHLNISREEENNSA